MNLPASTQHQNGDFNKLLMQANPYLLNAYENLNRIIKSLLIVIKKDP